MEDWEKQELEQQIKDQAKQIKSLQNELQKVKDDLSNDKRELNNKIDDKSYQNNIFILWVIAFIIAIISFSLNLKK